MPIVLLFGQLCFHTRGLSRASLAWYFLWMSIVMEHFVRSNWMFQHETFMQQGTVFFVPIPDSFNIFIIYWDLQGRWTCVRVCVCVCAWVCVCVFVLEIGIDWSRVKQRFMSFELCLRRCEVILTAFKFCGSLGRLCTWLVNFLRRGLSGRPFLLPLWRLQVLHVCGVLEIVDNNLRLHHWSAWKNIHELLDSHFTATAKCGLQKWWAIASACMQSRL